MKLTDTLFDNTVHTIFTPMPYRQSGPLSNVWELKIIPNDGEQYNTDPVAPNSPDVIPVVWKGKDRIEYGGGQMIWR